MVLAIDTKETVTLSFKAGPNYEAMKLVEASESLGASAASILN